jgi:hypothetical protein
MTPTILAVRMLIDRLRCPGPAESRHVLNGAIPEAKKPFVKTRASHAHILLIPACLYSFSAAQFISSQ